ncbi:hypothetical protein IWW36_002091 [Coemansia brasiliensis]|uniref:Importin N-terminal domain-containing protein n=1 Tax=Coemansia brasiliensis TaxID=2650707 RepID=A0A9W8M078_9FUNG|nr:hypothetical protein IWW36_002091 [Coemansia brasiliensis]
MDPQFVSNLQGLLERLAFASNTDTIRSVTASLSQQFYTTAVCIPALLSIAKDNEQWQVRQLAAVELRKRIPKYWEDVDESVQQQMREAILAAIVEESNDLARHGLARVISSMAKCDLPNQKWGDLIQFLYKCCQSPTTAHREIGVYVLDSLFETISDMLSAHMQHLFELFSSLINDPESLIVRVTTLEALGKMAECIEPDNRSAISTFQSLVPSMVQVLQKCLETNEEDSASRCFEVFNGIMVLDTPLLNRYIGDLIEFSISVGSNPMLDDNLRIMALNFIVWAASYVREIEGDA